MPNIEIQSISHLKKIISSTDHLVPNINENDREPSWDGDIYIYSDNGNNHKKDNLIGRVPVQVKGISVKFEPTSETIKFSINLSDLNNYYRERGALYFVIEVFNPESDRVDDVKYKVYYRVLSTYRINKLLTKANEQKTITVSLKQFPDTIKAIETCVRTAYERTKYRCADSIDIPLNRQIHINNDKLFIHVSEYDSSKSVIDTIYENGMSLLCKKDNGLIFPIMELDNLVSISASTHATVAIDNCSIELPIIFNRNSTVNEFYLGKIIHGILGNGVVAINFSPSQFAFQDNFYTYMLMSALKNVNKHLKINGMQLDLSLMDKTKLNISEIETYHHELEWICELLSSINSNRDIDLSCTNNDVDQNKLRFLYASVVKKQAILHDLAINIFGGDVKIDAINEKGVYIFKSKIFNLTVLLCAIRLSDSEFLITDYFKITITAVRNGQPITAYDFLELDDYVTVCNVDLDKIVSAYSVLPKTSHRNQLIYESIDKMLNAYDGVHEDLLSTEDIMRRNYANKLLTSAQSLCDMLYYKNKCADHNKAALFSMQVKHRRQLLTDDDIETLKFISDNMKHKDRMLMVATYLLLDDQTHAKNIFKNLSSKEQSDFLKSSFASLITNKDEFADIANKLKDNSPGVCAQTAQRSST